MYLLPAIEHIIGEVFNFNDFFFILAVTFGYILVFLAYVGAYFSFSSCIYLKNLNNIFLHSMILLPEDPGFCCLSRGGLFLYVLGDLEM